MNATESASSSYQVRSDGTLTIVNMPLRSIIALAYNVRPQLEETRIVGGNRELLMNRFDVLAKGLEGGNSDWRERLQLLLKQRFALRARQELRQAPVYAITVLRPDKLGPQLRPLTVACEPSAPESRSAAASTMCKNTMRSSHGTITIVSTGTVPQFATKVQPFLDRPVIDATGLKGEFAWRISFATNQQLSDSAEIYTAFKEQLGLALTPRTGVIDTLRIEEVGRPSLD
jgi:uncharacterized protein (TIGR03435 family)